MHLLNTLLSVQASSQSGTLPITSTTTLAGSTNATTSPTSPATDPTVPVPRLLIESIGVVDNLTQESPSVYQIFTLDWITPSTDTAAQTSTLHSSALSYANIVLYLLSLMLNLYLFLAIMISAHLKSRTNILMQNIFISNLLLIAIQLPLDIPISLYRLSQFSPEIGHWWCRTVSSLQIITEFVTASSIAILAVDKCQSICSKYSHRITNVVSVLLIVRVIWCLAFVASVPNWLYSRMQTSGPSNEHRWTLKCQLNVHHLLPSSIASASSSANGVHSAALMAPTILSFVCFYLVPLCITMVSYGKICCHLYHYAHRYSHVHDLQKRIRSIDKETVLMLSLVIVIFVASWAPYHLCRLLPILFEQLRADTPVKLWLMQHSTLLSTLLNPIVFTCFNRVTRERWIGRFRAVGFVSLHSSRSSFSSTGGDIITHSGEDKMHSLEKLLSELNNCSRTTQQCQITIESHIGNDRVRSLI